MRNIQRACLMKIVLLPEFPEVINSSNGIPLCL